VGPGLFGAIVADRRLIMGPNCSFSQDYRRRFTDAELLRILQNGCEAMEKLFDALKPDLVVGFVCVSILEYLAFLFARARAIRYLNLRTTRIGNRVLLADSHRDPAPEAARALLAGPACPEADAVARDWIATARAEHARYEGVTAPSVRPVQNFGFAGRRLTAPFRFLNRLRDYHVSGAADDNHAPGLIVPALYKAIVNPMRARLCDRLLRSRYVTADRLAGLRYAVFPLHTEPEISLLLYGRPLVNQIELLRAIAVSLPADMVLLVKEHPWMIGKRSRGAYRKMLDIPRVRLVSPALTVRTLIEHAALVCVHTGSSWLEAAVLRKPVLALGPVMGELLPDVMVRRCRDLTRLPETIASLLNEQRHDEAALHQLVAAIASCSIPANLYTGLLGRPAYTPSASAREDDIDRLADFVLRRAAEPPAHDAIPGGTW
jgi:hypothetical protein